MDSDVMLVESTTDASANEWDEFVRAQPEWTPYHLYGWRQVVADVHGHQGTYLVARDPSGAIRGVLPLVRVRSALFGRYLVSMPFLNYGGPLGTREATRTLVAEAARIADSTGIELLELRSSHELPIELHASHRKITVLLELPASDVDALWTSLPSKLRSQIRRPMKEGVTISFGPEQLDPFYHVFARHMRDLGTPVLPRAHFAAVCRAFGDSMWFGCAYLAGQPVAAGCGFRWSERFELVWASALREHNRLAPNMLLYWRFLERCVEDGARVFDFGRCTPGGGTHKFKLQWGGEDQPLWWYQHGPRSGGGTPSAGSGAFSLATKAWMRLPLSVANTLGPRIVKFIP